MDTTNIQIPYDRQQYMHLFHNEEMYDPEGPIKFSPTYNDLFMRLDDLVDFYDFIENDILNNLIEWFADGHTTYYRTSKYIYKYLILKDYTRANKTSKESIKVAIFDVDNWRRIDTSIVPIDYSIITPDFLKENESKMIL